MSATAAMPYFIKSSKNLSESEKHTAYQNATEAIELNLAGESNIIVKMSTINCLLKTFLPYFYWVGFYLVDHGRLKIGPYQGTLGCLYIDFSRGVCGKAASTRQTQVVSDVHTLEQGAAHIACDPNSQSEIVVPVSDNKGRLLAVLDVDSSLKGSFDEIDQHYLEAIVEQHFAQTESEKVYVI
ncbi:MAG: GAF domain-containing protein [Bacteroidota bacterium]